MKRNDKESKECFENKNKGNQRTSPAVPHLTRTRQTLFRSYLYPHSLHHAHTSPTFARLHDHHSRIYPRTFEHYFTRVGLLHCSFVRPLTNVNQQFLLYLVSTPMIFHNSILIASMLHNTFRKLLNDRFDEN